MFWKHKSVEVTVKNYTCVFLNVNNRNNPSNLSPMCMSLGGASVLIHDIYADTFVRAPIVYIIKFPPIYCGGLILFSYLEVFLNTIKNHLPVITERVLNVVFESFKSD